MNISSETVPKTSRDHRVWALPADAGCARHARDLVEMAMSAFDMPREVVCDAKLMISELATNAHQHASEYVPHELWFDRGGDELICAVFDALPMKELTGDLAFSGDYGRGLSIVAELSAGRWGLEAARSRLRSHVPGKCVWFACKLTKHGS
ncbi:ATP-binding protein [Actinomadura scrupuli]|uniref:ATP-binding protein n=1 Tax=Actinomadura scrupuli TaxID=559629 RepID=UPI003D957C67